MNKIGVRESPYMLIFLMLPQFIISAMSRGLNAFNTAYIINLLISYIIFYILIVLSKKSLCSVAAERNEAINKLTDIIFVVFMFTLTLYNYSLCTDAVSSVSSKIFTKDIIGFLPLVSAVLCSLLGIEALSRSSYLGFYAIGFVVLLITLLTFGGWDTENIYPLLGTNISDIASDYTSFSSFTALLGIYMLKDSFKDKAAPYKVIKKSLLISFVFAVILVTVCILTIPYPMGELYSFSLEGIFSMAKSGSFFHRFELLLIIAVLTFDIISVSLGLYLVSFTLSKLCKLNDNKPFILILSVILFYLNLLISDKNIIFDIYSITSITLFVILILKSQVIYRIFRKE